MINGAYYYTHIGYSPTLPQPLPSKLNNEQISPDWKIATDMIGSKGGALIGHYMLRDLSNKRLK